MIDFDLMLQKHAELRRKQGAAETLWEKATDTSVKMSGMPHGGGDGQPMERYMVEYLAAEAACKETEAELETMKKQLRRRMRRLKKWQHRDAIRLRFLEGKRMLEVAEGIHYELAQTNRFIKEAKALINNGRKDENGAPK